MNLITFFEKQLYAAQYDGDDADILTTRIAQFTDLNYIEEYLNKYAGLLDSPFWREHGYSSSPEDLRRITHQIVDEAIALISMINDLCLSRRTQEPYDLGEYFETLNGVYKLLWELVPMKGYGPQNPSFLRLYAIKLKDGAFVIADASIKLTQNMQDDPGLSAHVFRKINATRRFLIDNNIYQSDDA